MMVQYGQLFEEGTDLETKSLKQSKEPETI